MSVVNELFSEKFRPKNLNQLIVVPRIREELSHGLAQNFLFTGLQGIGKTSASFILSQNHPTLYINASSERGIDIVREKISKFCSTISLEGGSENLKCVLCDEIDGATPDFYSALRATTERYASTTRFLATCNNIQKIPEPVQSRFNVVSFDPINNEEEQYLINEFKIRVGKILDAIKVSYTDELLTKFVKNDFPDMRSLVLKVQSFYNIGVKELDQKNFNINFDFKDLFDICLSKPDAVNNYKFISGQYESRIDDTLFALGRDFPEYVKTNASSKIDKLPLAIISIAEYQYQKQFTIDPLVTLLAAVFKIKQIMQ